MASFREHIAFSSLLGTGYGVGATFLLNFSPSQAALAGYLAGMGGMLPDLDSPTGRPGQVIFGFTAAIAPLCLIGHVLRWWNLPSDTETVMLLLVSMYFLFRFGLAWVVDKLSVHRGMFHSIPAMAIAGEMTYLAYPSDLTTVRLLMGGGVALGFFSHLFLDEVYAIKWAGPVPVKKKSFGTAIKFAGKSFAATAFTYALLATLSYAMFQNAGLIEAPENPSTQPVAEEEIEDANDLVEETEGVLVPIEEAVLPPGYSTDAPAFR